MIGDGRKGRLFWKDRRNGIEKLARRLNRKVGKEVGKALEKKCLL